MTSVFGGQLTGITVSDALLNATQCEAHGCMGMSRANRQLGVSSCFLYVGVAISLSSIPLLTLFTTPTTYTFTAEV